jgi:hypothetical protein
VKGCRFKVEDGRRILEESVFKPEFSRPEQLPSPERMDEDHRQWRHAVIDIARSCGHELTHGVAAKLINVYLKCRFVCGGHHAHENVRSLHPPIDDVLLRRLAEDDCGGFKADWCKAHRTRWSNFKSVDYEVVIDRIRQTQEQRGEPLWEIERYWKGNQ